MSIDEHDYEPSLDAALAHTRSWLASLATRRVTPSVTADDVEARLPAQLPEAGADPVAVLDTLVRTVEDALAAMPSSRFFGFVIGGHHPAALAADWLVSAWDQNAALRFSTPGTAGVEAVAGRWLLQALGLPEGADVGFVTGATMANFTCLAAARHAVLGRAGWDVGALGLAGGPRVHVLVGRERHDTVDLALRYLGLGRPVEVAADDQGRMRPDALAAALADVPEGAPLIVVAQAGNIHSGAFDPFEDVVAQVHARGGWVHVDGAFGLWAAASPSTRHLVAGLAGADSWATDAHKTLNVPYDSGIAIVADVAAMRAAMVMQGPYLQQDATGVGDPHDKTPELSRRARGVPVWAALASLGRDGIAALVDRLVGNARLVAALAGEVPGVEVLNDVAFTQVCLAFGDDATTRAVERRILDEGRVWISGSRWRGRAVLRFSISNATTSAEDVALAMDAVRRACLAP
ncbi:MAG: pyridoxal-dependent decarboxylase [Kineosporiaceae bacterium]